MSCKIHLDDLSNKHREIINNKLEVNLGRYGFYQPFEYDEKTGYLYLPFNYAYNIIKCSKRPSRDNYSINDTEFCGELRPHQEKVRKEANTFLNKRGTVTISAYPGFGKTCLSVKMACDIKFKTLVVTHSVPMISQWKDAILSFCPNARVQSLGAKSKIDNDCDFYIIFADNIRKFNKEDFSDIGTLIVDEMHIIMSKKRSQGLFNIIPRYLIALSATPYRHDEFESLIEFYFGYYQIIRTLKMPHTVYRINTGFRPTAEYKNGRLNWDRILREQSQNTERNESIVNIITAFDSRNFLVIVKRVQHGRKLAKMLEKIGEHVATLLQDEQDFDKSARIIIGTPQKVGTGFDHKKLDAMILAADIEAYFIQYMGRVFRREDSDPLIFDLVDNNRSLEKHYRTREEEYIKCGGKIKIYKPRSTDPVQS